MRFLSLAGAGWVVVGSGCTDPGPRAPFPARLEATVGEHRLDVNVWIWQSAGVAYEIAPDEHVRVALRDQVVDCLFRNSVDPTYYPAYMAAFALPDEVAGDEPITLTLTRGDEELVHVVATAPAPFKLDAPATSPFQSDITVRWSPTSSDRMSWIAFDGLHASEGPIREDSGELTLPWKALGDPLEDVDLEFHRTRAVESDKSYATVTQTRTAHIRFGT